MALQRRASGELLMTSSGALADECCCGGTPPPPTANCAWTLSPASLVFNCTGQAGAFNVNVLTGSNCGWEASVTSGGAYVTINSPSSGSGSSTIGFDLSSNAGVDRTAEITILTTVVSPLGPAGSLIGIFDITQTECGGVPVGGGGAPPPLGESCSWEISPGAGGFDCTSQNGFFNVNTQLGCDWAASVISGGSFITIFSGSTGTDAGTVQFSLSQNFGSARGGQIEVITTVLSNLGPAGTVIGFFNIGQISFDDCTGGGGGAGSPCVWDVSPKNWYSPDPCSAGIGTTQVVTDIGCSWNATVTSGGGFITITGGSSGLSSGTITFDVDANNTSSHRTGQITVTTAVASPLGPIGTVVAYINVDQETCAPCVCPGSGLALVYAISGYVDGFIPTCLSSPVNGPVSAWDGSVDQTVPCQWVLDPTKPGSGDRIMDTENPPNHTRITSNLILNTILCRWEYSVTDIDRGILWEGIKTTGGTPVGVYTKTAGCAAGPATISIV